MEEIRISVVIPAWNAAATLSETLDTVFAQQGPRFEVIVVDDGSTDETPRVLERLAAERPGDLRWESIPNSGGPSRPRNVGLEMARGEFVAMFDSDDLMEPGKLAAQLTVFDLHPATDLCCTDFRVIDEDGGLLQESFLAEYTSFREHLRPVAGAADLPPVALFQGPDLHRALIYANFVGTSSVMARRLALQEAGGFDESLGNGDDLDMWFKLARTGKTFAFLDVKGHRYRKTAGGVTARGWRRLPAVAEVRRRQLDYVTDEASRAFLEDVIHGCKLGEAWGLRKEGRYAEATAAYREAQAMKWTREAFLGMWRARLMGMVRR